MSQHFILNNQFAKLSFSEKINKSYFGWCAYLLSIYVDKQVYISLKKDFLYFKNYLNLPELLFYFGIGLLFLTNIVLFPIYALILKFYWKYRYLKTLRNSQTPLTDMIVFDQSNSYINGMRVLKIISEHSTNDTIYYKVLLENKEIYNIPREHILFEEELLSKKISLERELEIINYSLQLFNKKIEYKED